MMPFFAAEGIFFYFADEKGLLSFKSYLTMRQHIISISQRRMTYAIYGSNKRIPFQGSGGTA